MWGCRGEAGCLIQSQCETVDICASRSPAPAPTPRPPPPPTHTSAAPLHYVTGAVLRWISHKSPMQHIQHATSSLTSLIMDEEIVIQE